MADMQAGIGPFVGVAAEPRLGHRRHRDGHRAGRYRRHDRHRARRGVHDATTRQRGCVIVAGVFTVAASGLILLSRHFWVVASAQAATPSPVR